MNNPSSRLSKKIFQLNPPGTPGLVRDSVWVCLDHVGEASQGLAELPLPAEDEVPLAEHVPLLAVDVDSGARGVAVVLCHHAAQRLLLVAVVAVDHLPSAALGHADGAFQHSDHLQRLPLVRLAVDGVQGFYAGLHGEDCCGGDGAVGMGVGDGAGFSGGVHLVLV